MRKKKSELLLNNLLLLSLFKIFASVPALGQTNWVTDRGVHLQPDSHQPTVQQSFVDPQFNTRITRITDAYNSRLPGVVPEYSKRQAWNADESMLLLRQGDGVVRLYNGQTLRFIRTLNAVYGEDVFWHPTNANIIYFNPINALYKYDVKKNRVSLIKEFSAYSFANTRAEGNLSRDGRYYAFVGQMYNERTGEVSFKDLVLFDLYSQEIVKTLALPKNLPGFDWISVSPSGKYIVVDYANDEVGNFRGVEVYNLNFERIWQKPLGAGHSDLTLDNTGQDYLVMDIYDPNSNTTKFKRFHLASGQFSTLLEVAPLFDQHISCQNTNQNNWCFFSTFGFVGRLVDDLLRWLPFEDEIFAINIKTKAVRRIAHHHSRRYSPSTPDSDRSVYIAEPHATVNRAGTKILFGSNWKVDVSRESSVDTYLVDFSDKPF